MVSTTTQMQKDSKRSRPPGPVVPERAKPTHHLTSAVISLLPETFTWTEAETAKLAALAEELNCAPAVARRLLVFVLVYVSVYQRKSPSLNSRRFSPHFRSSGATEEAARFPARLQEMDFIYVQADYWAKMRAKRYGVGKAGSELLTRVWAAICLPARRPHAG